MFHTKNGLYIGVRSSGGPSWNTPRHTTGVILDSYKGHICWISCVLRGTKTTKYEWVLWTLGVIISGHYHQIPNRCMIFCLLSFYHRENHHKPPVSGNLVLGTSNKPQQLYRVLPRLSMLGLHQPFDLVMVRSVLNFFASPRHFVRSMCGEPVLKILKFKVLGTVYFPVPHFKILVLHEVGQRKMG